jgi:hypothetical protein
MVSRSALHSDMIHRISLRQEQMIGKSEFRSDIRWDIGKSRASRPDASSRLSGKGWESDNELQHWNKPIHPGGAFRQGNFILYCAPCPRYKAGLAGHLLAKADLAFTSTLPGTPSPWGELRFREWTQKSNLTSSQSLGHCNAFSNNPRRRRNSCSEQRGPRWEFRENHQLWKWSPTRKPVVPFNHPCGATSR